MNRSAKHSGIGINIYEMTFLSVKNICLWLLVIYVNTKALNCLFFIYDTTSFIRKRPAEYLYINIDSP